MAMTASSAIFISFTPNPSANKNGRKFRKIFAKKRDLQEKPTTQQQKPLFPLRLSKSILSRTAIAVFGLGFIDAGYSGDWSRIGVISSQTEDLLKISAFLVVPLCVFLILSITEEPN